MPHPGKPATIILGSLLRYVRSIIFLAQFIHSCEILILSELISFTEYILSSLNTAVEETPIREPFFAVTYPSIRLDIFVW